jgi:hypothetical protein
MITDRLLSALSLSALVAGVAALDRLLGLSATTALHRDSWVEIWTRATDSLRSIAVVRHLLVSFSQDYMSFVMYGAGLLLILVFIHRA